MKFVPDLAGQEQIVKGPGVARALREEADGLRDAVEGQAQRFANTGRFAGSIEVGDVERIAGGLSISVYTTDPDGHIVEWGSVNNPPYAPLRKGVASTGLRFREEGR